MGRGSVRETSVVVPNESPLLRAAPGDRVELAVPHRQWPVRPAAGHPGYSAFGSQPRTGDSFGEAEREVHGDTRRQVGKGLPDACTVVVESFDDAFLGPDPGEVWGVETEVALHVSVRVGVAEWQPDVVVEFAQWVRHGERLSS